MYLIFMALNPEEKIILAKRSNADPVSRHHALTRTLLSDLYPGSLVFSPLEAIPPAVRQMGGEVVLVTVYKSRRKDGVGRTCGSFESWAVVR